MTVAEPGAAVPKGVADQAVSHLRQVPSQQLAADAFARTDQQPGSQQQQQRFADGKETPPGNKSPAAVQQGDGQARQHQPGNPADGKQAQLRAVQACAGPIQKDHGFAAFPADCQHGQKQQADAALARQLPISMAAQVILE
ncbi:hypothetical protein D3C85_1282670 [compost metagenome]